MLLLSCHINLTFSTDLCGVLSRFGICKLRVPTSPERMSATVSAAASTRGKSSGEPQTPSARHALPFQPRQLYREPTKQKKSPNIVPLILLLWLEDRYASRKTKLWTAVYFNSIKIIKGSCALLRLKHES